MEKLKAEKAAAKKQAQIEAKRAEKLEKQRIAKEKKEKAAAEAKAKAEAKAQQNAREAQQSNSSADTSQSNNREKIVLRTRTGSKYHTHKCGNGTYYEVTLGEAIDAGLEPCKKCF